MEGVKTKVYIIDITLYSINYILKRTKGLWKNGYNEFPFLENILSFLTNIC